MPLLLQQYWVCITWIFCSLANIICGALCLKFVARYWRPDLSFKAFLTAAIFCDITSSSTYLYQAGYHLIWGYAFSHSKSNSQSLGTSDEPFLSPRQCYGTIFVRVFSAETASSFLFVLAIDRFVSIVWPKFFEKCSSCTPYLYVTVVEVLLGQALATLVGLWANPPTFQVHLCLLEICQTYKSPFFHWINMALGVVSRIAPVLLYVGIWHRLSWRKIDNPELTAKSTESPDIVTSSANGKLVEFTGLLIVWQLITFSIGLMAQNWHYSNGDDRIGYLEVIRMSLGFGGWLMFWFNQDRKYSSLD